MQGSSAWGESAGKSLMSQLQAANAAKSAASAGGPAAEQGLSAADNVAAPPSASSQYVGAYSAPGLPTAAPAAAAPAPPVVPTTSEPKTAAELDAMQLNFGSFSLGGTGAGGLGDFGSGFGASAYGQPAAAAPEPAANLQGLKQGAPQEAPVAAPAAPSAADYGKPTNYGTYTLQVDGGGWVGVCWGVSAGLGGGALGPGRGSQGMAGQRGVGRARASTGGYRPADVDVEDL